MELAYYRHTFPTEETMPKIETVTARDRLKPRREPYWNRIERGFYLGFRRMTKDSAGSWIARVFEASTGRRQRPLGDFDHLPPHERYGAALKAAREWLEHLGRGGHAGVTTVRDVCEAYVERLKAEKAATARPARRRPDHAPTMIVPAAKDAEDRFRAYVLNLPWLADLDVAKATPKHFDDWRKSLMKTATRSGPNRGKTRTNSTLNRDMTSFRAALNYALRKGRVTSDFAWRNSLLPIKNADGRRDAYLDRQQRAELLSRAPEDLACLIRAMSLVPLRPGALAALTAGAFDLRTRVLRVGKDKAGADRRVKLPDVTAEVFAANAKDKLPGAPLFSQASGRPWNKDAWKGPVKAAALAARLPEGTTIYALRHGVITDLVTGGLDLLTVAIISGTSVKMIERHYGHLRAEHATAALAMLAT